MAPSDACLDDVLRALDKCRPHRVHDKWPFGPLEIETVAMDVPIANVHKSLGFHFAMGHSDDGNTHMSI